ncbi:MAG: hypothetical protein MJ188_03330 [Treponema sp.]|nr:hypothetical protein [Treponema sp.]
MKKIIKTFSKFIILSAFTAISSISCVRESVFDNVRNDIKTREATVSGPISSIARYSAKTSDGNTEEWLLLAANSGLRYKKADSEEYNDWKVLDEEELPKSLHSFDYYNGREKPAHKGQQIIKVVSDKDTLYLVTVSYATNDNEGISYPEDFHVWANSFEVKIEESEDGPKIVLAKTGDWVEVASSFRPDGKGQNDKEKSFFPIETIYNNYYYNNFNVFSTNSPNPEHRKAYIRSGDNIYYELNGKNVLTTDQWLNPTGTEIYAIDSTDAEKDKDFSFTKDDTKYNDIDSVAYFNGKYYFFDSIAVTTNESATKDATVVYFARSRNEKKDKYDHSHAQTKRLFYFETKDFSENGLMDSSFIPKVFEEELGGYISALTVTKDSLIIGRADYSLNTNTNGGLTRILLTENDLLQDKTALFDTNASTQLSGLYQIYTLLSVYATDKTEEENIIYSSIGIKSSSASTSASYGNIGLWSYYPSRGNWNRE